MVENSKGEWSSTKDPQGDQLCASEAVLKKVCVCVWLCVREREIEREKEREEREGEEGKSPIRALNERTLLSHLLLSDSHS